MSAINIKNFDIAGNNFRAYYDAQNKLIFVVDSTTDARMPNVLLVINPSGDRKWDDVLVNDYGIDLETIRPKVNNRYQKLDIEYSGLAEYDALINAFLAGTDTTDALENLDKFRSGAAWRAATARLETAQSVAARTRDTIARTRDTITDLNATLKNLRAKLSEQRAEIGREPTKQSAAKILRTEAQIDATNAKLRRAKKRLSNAEKRLDDANSDADIARAILARTDVSEYKPVVQMVPAQPAPTAVMAPSIDDDDDDNFGIVVDDDQFDDDIVEIPPLLDSDPKIIDENIAFKPINFDDTPVVPAATQPTPQVNINIFKPETPVVDVESTPEPEPIPVPVFEPDVDDEEETTETETSPIPAPITFTPPVMDEEPAPVVDSRFAPITFDAPDVDDDDTESDSEPETAPLGPIDFHPIVDMPDEIEDEIETLPVLDTMRPVVDEPTPAPITSPVDFSDAERPVSPAPIVTDDTPAPVVELNVTPVVNESTPKKPAALYYVMLIILIVLSVFTLWLYQGSSDNATTPDLTAAAPAIVETQTTDDAANVVTDIVGDDAFITTDAEPIPEPVAETVVEPEPVVEKDVVMDLTPAEIIPVPEPEPEPIVEPEPIPEPVPVEPTVDAVAEPEPEPIPEPVPVEPTPVTPIPTPEEIILSKPAYGVTADDDVFIDATDYSEPQIIRPADTMIYEPEPVIYEPTPAPVAIAPTPIYEPAPAPVYESALVYDTTATQVVTSEVFEEATCSDGSLPDINGCCGMEIFTDMEDGTFACCNPDGIDCFPPIEL